MRSEPIELLHKDAMVRSLRRPLDRYLQMPGATDVVVNRPGEVFVEIGPTWHRFDAPDLTFERCSQLAQVVATYTDQHIGAHLPIMTAMLPGGERMQIVMPPACEQDTISYSIRKPGSCTKPMAEYQDEGFFDRYVWARPEGFDLQPSRTAAGGIELRPSSRGDLASTRRNDLDSTERVLMGLLENNDLGGFLRTAVLAKKNIAVVGDTGSGKTTLMKSMCEWIPACERLVTIEDTRELFLSQPNRVHLLYSRGGQGVAQVTPSDLIASCMRMKPDRVLLAELRGAEAFDFLKLMTSGHGGSITSFHAESCALAGERYVFMAKEHKDALIYETNALKRLVALTIDVIVHVVAKVVHDQNGNPSRKERYVAEVRYDPVEKLQARFGRSTLHHA